MSVFSWQRAILGLVSLLVWLALPACGQEKVDKWRTPSAILGKAFLKIPAGEEDPGDNGPDDSTELDAIDGRMGSVQFSHFTHSSNSEEGYGIPCASCHHNVAKGEDPEFGCGECHRAPDLTDDPAYAGPDDNMLLFGEAQDLRRLAPVLFNHFTHASSRGLKISCQSCHHKDGVIAPCADCHQEREIIDGAQTISRRKRAFHKQCKGCHLAAKQNDPMSSVPTECKECHRWRALAPAEEIPSLEGAYHRGCVTCHIKLLAADGNTKAPVRNCDGCHKAVTAPSELPVQAVADKPVPAEATPVEPPVAEVAVDNSNDDKGRERFVIDHLQKNKPATPFEHHEHQEYGEPCSRCHHEKVAMPSCRPACRNCHGDGVEMKHIYHRLCIRCHVDNGAETHCMTCHPQQG